MPALTRSANEVYFCPRRKVIRLLYKSAERILENTLFADDTPKIGKIGKQNNSWWNKDQVSRWSRINNSL